jgi:hypothetical protein
MSNVTRGIGYLSSLEGYRARIWVAQASRCVTRGLLHSALPNPRSQP